MNHTLKGILAGIVATICMSILIVLKNQMGIFPSIDAIQVFTNISAQFFGTEVDPSFGWMWFSLIAGVVWGGIFGGFERKGVRAIWPGKTDLTEGLSFSVLAWLVAMFVFMPMAGFGLFAMDSGIQAPLLSLLGHLIYGAILGSVYAWLQKEGPLEIKDPFIGRPSM